MLTQAVILAARREYEEADRSMDKQIAYLASKYGADIRTLHCGEMDISSAELRSMIARGQSIADYVPREVSEYIAAHGLYQELEP